MIDFHTYTHTKMAQQERQQCVVLRAYVVPNVTPGRDHRRFALGLEGREGVWLGVKDVGNVRDPVPGVPWACETTGGINGASVRTAGTRVDRGNLL